MDRLFVAVWPPDDVAAHLARLPHPVEAGVRWTPAANWHITLRFIGESKVDEVAARLAGAGFPRVSATLGPAVRRLGPRQIVVPVAGVDPLAAAVRAATDGLGELDRHPFHGHLTIARTRPHAHSSLIGAPFDAGFAVERIALVASDLRAGGAVYSTVATFATARS